MKKIKAVIFGLGNRGKCYGGYAIEHPDELEIVQVVDHNQTALEYAKTLFNLSDDALFSSFEDWMERAMAQDRGSHSALNLRPLSR